MNIVELSQKRYTTKHYDGTKKISDELKQQLLQVLRNCPSSVNSQPWHFMVIHSDEMKQRILPAIAPFNHARITDASDIIVFCARKDLDSAFLDRLLQQEEQDGRFPDEKLKNELAQGRRFFVDLNSETEEKQAIWKNKQIYLALGFAMFAAAELGIDSTAIEGFEPSKMDEILDLEAKGLYSVVALSLGYRADNDSNAKRPKSRLPLDEIITTL